MGTFPDTHAAITHLRDAAERIEQAHASHEPGAVDDYDAAVQDAQDAVAYLTGGS